MKAKAHSFLGYGYTLGVCIASGIVFLTASSAAVVMGLFYESNSYASLSSIIVYSLVALFFLIPFVQSIILLIRFGKASKSDGTVSPCSVEKVKCKRLIMETSILSVDGQEHESEPIIGFGRLSLMIMKKGGADRQCLVKDGKYYLLS